MSIIDSIFLHNLKFLSKEKNKILSPFLILGFYCKLNPTAIWDTLRLEVQAEIIGE